MSKSPATPGWVKIVLFIFLVAILSLSYTYLKSFLIKESKPLTSEELRLIYNSNNSMDCERITGVEVSRVRDACFLKEAMRTMDINLCYKIGDGKFSGRLENISMKQRCIEQLTPFDFNQTFVSAVLALNDPKACNQLSDPHYYYSRNKCLYDNAVMKEDASVCKSIDSEEMKQLCENAVEKALSL